MNNIEQIAMVCHEANRAYCKSIGDFTQPEWEDTHGWQRDSAIDGVKNIINGIVKSPRNSHEQWMKHKISDGWKYGDIKNPDTKEHPCLVSYDDLSKEQRMKDCIFFGIVNSMYFK